jgi:hypothetical protein
LAVVVVTEVRGKSRHVPGVFVCCRRAAGRHRRSIRRAIDRANARAIMTKRSLTRRTCIVRNVKVETGAIFSIGEKDLTSCDH